MLFNLGKKVRFGIGTKQISLAMDLAKDAANYDERKDDFHCRLFQVQIGFRWFD